MGWLARHYPLCLGRDERGGKPVVIIPLAGNLRAIRARVVHDEWGGAIRGHDGGAHWVVSSLGLAPSLPLTSLPPLTTITTIKYMYGDILVQQYCIVYVLYMYSRCLVCD